MTSVLPQIARNLVLIIALLILPAIAQSQGTPPLYKGFKYDSVFRFGYHASDAGNARIFRDSLHFSFEQTYQGPSNWANFLNDSGNWNYPGGRFIHDMRKAGWDSMKVVGMNIRLLS